MKLKYFQILFVSIVLTYLLLTFLTPIDPATIARYGLSEFQVRLIGMSVSFPLACIWLIGLYGYSRFHAYTRMIAKEKEGKAFQDITKGIMLLSISLPVSSLFSSLLRRVTVDVPGASAYIPVGRSFIPLMFQLLAFTLLAVGSAKLLTLIRPKVTVKYSQAVLLGMLAVASIFTYVVVARPFGGSVAANYALPAWLVVITLVIPFLYAWYQGGLAIYQLHLYRHRVVGLIYKKMLKDLVAGFTAIVVSSILIQVVSSFAQNLQRLNFTPMLITTYLLILVYGIGFVLLARGARQLKKIEEV